MQRNSNVTKQAGFTGIELLVIITFITSLVFVKVLTVNLLSGPVSISKLRANADLLDDVAILRSAPNNGSILEVRIFDEAGASSVLQTLDAPSYPRKVITTDLNGDGKDDIVSLHGPASSASGTVALFRNNGFGSFSLSSINAGVANPTDIAAGDLNNDGRPDLVVTSGNSANGFVFSSIYNLNGTSFGTAVQQTLSQSQGFGDSGGLAGSGLPSRRKAAPEQATIKPDARLELAGVAELEEIQTQLSVTGVRAVSIANVVGDSRKDVIVALADFGGSILQVLENTPSGLVFRFQIALAQGGEPSAVAVADFNRDAFLDIAVADSNAQSVLVLMNMSGNGFGPAEVLPTAEAPVALSVADLDSDLFPDLIVSTEAGVLSNGHAAITVLMNNHLGSFIRSDVDLGADPNTGALNAKAAISGNFSVLGNQSDLLVMHAWSPTLAVYSLWP